MNKPPSARRAAAWPIVITLLAFALRVWRLDAHALWWDEGISVYLSGLSPGAILAERAGDVHPPGYFILLKAWLALTGPGAFAARTLSVVCGTLSVPALLALGRRIGPPRVGLIAAGLFAISPVHVDHAQEARMYALVPLLGIVSTYALLRLIDDRPNRGAAAIAYGATLVGAAYAHYYALALPAFHACALVLTGSGRRGAPLRRWALAAAVALALLLPWAAYVGPRFTGAAGTKVAAEGDPALSPAKYVAGLLVASATGYRAPPATGTWLIALSALALAFGGAAAWYRYRGRSVWWPVCYLTVPVVAGYAVNTRFPFDAYARLLAFATPGLLLLWAAAIAAAAARSRDLGLALGGAVAWVLLFGTLGHYATPRPTGGAYPALIARVAAETGPDTVVIVDFPWQAGYLAAYAPRSGPTPYLPPGASWAADPDRMAHDLDALIEAHGAVWYAGYQGLGGTRGRNIEAYLGNNYYPAVDEWFGDTRLLLYGGPRQVGPDDLAELPTGATHDAVVTLEAAALPRPEVRAGEVLPVTLRWRAEAAPLPARLKAFVHLIDEQGRILAQRDAEPAGAEHPTGEWQPGDRVTGHLGVLVPRSTAAGRYQLVTGLYHRVTGERLPLGDGLDHVTLGAIEVTTP